MTEEEKDLINLKIAISPEKYIRELLKENQELKKQLEEKQNPLKGIFAQVSDDTLLRDCGNMNAEIKELKNQQKEFIEYLENEIENWSGNYEPYTNEVNIDEPLTEDMLRDILSKYKEIIGGKDEELSKNSR